MRSHFNNQEKKITKVEKKFVQLNPVKSFYELTCKKEISLIAKKSSQPVVDVELMQQAIQKAIEKLQVYSEWLEKNCTVTVIDDGTQELDFGEDEE